MKRDNIPYDDLCYLFTAQLPFEKLKFFCRLFNVVYEQPLDDEMPDWEIEIRGKLYDEMVGVE